MQASRKAYFKKSLSIAWPAVLEFFFIAIAGIIDTFMVSSLGPASIAAIGLTTQPKFIALSVFFAINAAVSALIARRQGEGDRDKANTTLTTALYLMVLFVIVVDLIMVPFANQILKFAGSNAETHKLAYDYYMIIMLGIFFNSLSMLINSAHRGCGHTQIAFITNLVSSAVNIGLNFLLIEGRLGFPKLGVKGAAYATVAGTIVASIMCVISLTNKNSYMNFKTMAKNRFRFSLEIAREIKNLAVNLFIENVSARIGFMITAISAAKLGTEAFAAHNVGMNLLSLSFSFGNGMQVAAIALTGNALGAGEKEEAKIYGKSCQQLGFIFSVIISLIMVIFGRNIFSIFFYEDHILDMGVLISRFLTVIVLLQISQVIYGGCLRAAGDVKYTLGVALVSVTFIRSIVTLICVKVFDLGLAGIWIGILSDQASRFISLRHRFNLGEWVHKKI
ncbi:MATE family efflux transporter [uncultured Anaerococcus sp.]|uniref:MATE family efflux transporter n=1 Tax=uncultured Anaerococcus sp. TaxID=293428 RepID=UPI0025E521CC|nr:MATE family efflux transporter [uncultured Anaerococcus sp.]